MIKFGNIFLNHGGGSVGGWVNIFDETFLGCLGGYSFDVVGECVLIIILNR